MKRIKGLLFDKDGTLYDFHATWGVWTGTFIREIARDDAEADALASEFGFDLVTRSYRDDSAGIAGTPRDFVDAIQRVMPEADGDTLLDHILTSSSRAPLAEAVPLKPYLDGLLTAGLTLGVATNDGESVARAHLETSGVLDRFAFVVGSDSGFGAKPQPGMQKAFLETSGLLPEEVAMVGDSLHDLHAGRAAGMATIGVLTGQAGAEALAPSADVVLKDIGEIPGWLAGA